MKVREVVRLLTNDGWVQVAQKGSHRQFTHVTKRGKVTVPAEITQEELQKTALADPKIKLLLEGKTIKKVIVVPGKLVNIVVA